MPVEQDNDGVVEFSSAHVEPVESEFVVQHRAIPRRAYTIEEVCGILGLYAGLKTGTIPPEAR